MKDEIKGKAHEIKGKVTGDKGEEMRGKAEQMGDKARRTGRDIKEDISGETDEERAEREREAETVREQRSW